jgi:hypothetical protein
VASGLVPGCLLLDIYGWRACSRVSDSPGRMHSDRYRMVLIEIESAKFTNNEFGMELRLLPLLVDV